MTKYIGTKLISATPMTRAEYNTYRGWDLPADEDGNDLGYLVEYMDGGKANHPDHAGYISWSPAEQFDAAYRPIVAMTFGLAIEAAKRGHKIAREGWNGKNMFVALMDPLYLPPFSHQEAGPKVNDRTARYIGEDTPLDSQGYFAMFTAAAQWQPGWLASQADMLAEDWTIVD